MAFSECLNFNIYLAMFIFIRKCYVYLWKQNLLFFFSFFQVRDVRLPRHLKPELYKLELLPFIIPDNFTIRGHLELTLECVAVSKNVTLHVADMTLSMTTLAEHSGAHS